MSMQIAQKIPFRPTLCPKCINYIMASNRCRAYAVESWPSPLFAVFSSETADTCTRFYPSKEVESPIPEEPAPVEEEAAPAAETASEPEAVSIPVPESPMAAEEAPVKVEPQQVQAAAVEEMKAPPPVRGEPRIFCPKCSVENPKGADRCQRCNSALLPSEGAGTRIGNFSMMIIIAAGLGYLVYHWYIQNPSSAPNIPMLDAILNPIVLGLAAVIAFFTAFGVLLRRTPEYVKYQNRATRHEKLNPWQSVEDLERALDTAPDKEQGKLIKQRAKLYEKLGFTEDAARDYLILLTSPGRFKEEAGWVSMLTGADSGTYENSRRSSEIKTILTSGNAIAVGYCPQCDLAVELNKDLRCIIHPKTKGREVEYVIPSDVLAGKLAVMQKMEARRPKISEQISKLLVEGKAVAIGYCPKCTGVVELDPERCCQVHPKARIKNIHYAVPRDVQTARKRIFKSQQGNRKGNYRVILYIVSLIFIAYAIVILLDIDLAAIFQR